jgi:acyl-coenzyme A thioesterase 9
MLKIARAAAPRGARLLCATTSAGRHQTPIVDALWRKRAETKAAEAGVVDERPGSRELVEKAPQQSSNSMLYAFSSDERLADTYRNPWGHVRVGRLLEDLDALAGTIAFDHCHTPGEPDMHLVTASVDRIVYRHRPNLKDDITFEGMPTWVGRSSMEIGMRATASWTEEPFLEAAFTFVARDPQTNRPAAINPLAIPAEGEEARRFAVGAQRDAARKALRQLAKESPTGHTLDQETILSAHDLLAQSKRLLSMPALADPTEILMSETRLHNALIAQPQQRNTAGRVFGGFLMRRAFELAHTTAYLFGGRRPIFLELDEVKFASAVSVGDLLKFESCVLYTSEAMDVDGRLTVHVEVTADVIKPEQRSSVTSNTFNFTFGVAANADGSGRAARRGEEGGPNLRRVLPATHEEAYRIMERYRADLRQRAEDEARSEAD